MAEEIQGITAITVGGYKSIRDETTIDIRPLTILAGANSSGKSSIMQPMLLVKQTLDASHDPGPLRLDGPHVRFTRYEQLVPGEEAESNHVMLAGFEIGRETKLLCEFRLTAKPKEKIRQFEVSRMRVESSNASYELTPSMPEEQLIPLLNEDFRRIVGEWQQKEESSSEIDSKIDFGWNVRSSRCFLYVGMYEKEREYQFPPSFTDLVFDPVPQTRTAIVNAVHLPGLRGNPERTYRLTAAQGPGFQGPFHPYTASLISRWKGEKSRRVKWVEDCMKRLALAGSVEAVNIDDVHVEIRVGLPQATLGSKRHDGHFNIADVGFGVSQVLPVLTALAVAELGQMVFIEQPELHLHPRAQVALASVLADAAKRGVRVVIETHSSQLLQGVMTLIAEDKLDHEDVMLHWFSRDEEGHTKINSVEPDRNGAYGDWPEDFADVELGIQKQHLDAVAEREFAT